MLPDLRPPLSSSSGAQRGLAVLGSTGSIGTQALDVAALFPERLRVVALSAGSNATLLAEQALKFRPIAVALADESGARALEAALSGTGIDVGIGPEAVAALAALEEVDVALAAIVGAAGLRPTLAAIRAGKTVALSNKESLVVAGALVAREAAASGSRILPVDSEHSAIFQCLIGESLADVEMLTLTASGGPFRSRDAASFDAITPEEALRHPNWAMGAKITIDSATLMNKGLEVIEAHWLFGIDADRIDVAVHPQSAVHSVVTFCDGSAKAQLGVPDMRVPIQYALSYPQRWPAAHARLDFPSLGSLDFAPPDLTRFPCLSLAYGALREGGAVPAALNAANEIAVAQFLNGAIRFTDIPRVVEIGMMAGRDGSADSLGDLMDVDASARRAARESANMLQVA